MSDPIICVENLGKKYQLGRNASQDGARYRTLRDTVAQGTRNFFRNPRSAFRNGSSTEEFWALKDVSFEVGQGEVVGIIGRNGAGKSTLLKILSRITEPTTGKVRIKGRVASLLEVGTGFHPELTGRENIFLNGAILGMTRAEIKSKFDEIVAFAEIEKFLDTPVKRYSSGMYVRLAFAVAAHLEPEILIVDEVLAVGDAEFQKKCLGKMEEASRSGRTILFVSHEMNSIQSLCQRALLLRSGELAEDGLSAAVVSSYLKTSTRASIWQRDTDHSAKTANPWFRAVRLAVVAQDRTTLNRDARADEAVGVLIEGDIETLDPALNVGFAVYAAATNTLLFWALQNDVALKHWPRLRIGRNRLVGFIPAHLLNEAEYRIELVSSLHRRIWMSQPGVDAPAVRLVVRGGLSESPHWVEPRPGLLAPVLTFHHVDETPAAEASVATGSAGAE